MMLRAFPLLLAALLVAGSADAQIDPLSPEGQVRAAEQRRYRAMIEVDVAELEVLLADELRFTHADGSVESKYEFIASLESGNLDYQAIDTSQITIRVYGEAAVVTGTARLRLVANGARRRPHLLFTAVYAKSEGRWRMVAYQSTQHP